MVHTSIAINEDTPLVYHNERRQRYANLWQLVLFIIALIGIGFIIGMMRDTSTLIVYILYTSFLTLMLAAMYCMDVISFNTTRLLAIFISLEILTIGLIVNRFVLKSDNNHE